MSSPAGLPGLPGPCSGGASPSGCSARVPSKRGPRNQPRRRHDAGAICNRRTIVAEITVEDPALAQRRTLRRHRSFATALLVAMGLIYVGATWLGETGFWIDLLRAGTEAALVGGRPTGSPSPPCSVTRSACRSRIPPLSPATRTASRSEEHTSELQVTNAHLVCR